MRPTLITGATGFAGSHLVDRLAGRVPLVAWHRPGKPAPGSSRGINWQAVDVLDAPGVLRSIAETRPSRVYHIAGASRLDTAWDDVVPHLQTNVLGTHNLLEAVRQVGEDCRVLVVSSAMVYKVGDGPIDEETPLVPSSPYGLSKLAQDQLALRAADDDALDVVLARPFNHAGPRQNPSFAMSSFARQVALIEAGRAQPDIHVGNLDARRDLTDVRDVVEAYECLMQSAPRGRPYNICSGRAVRIGDLLDALVRQSRASVRIVVDRERLRPNDIPILVGNSARIQREVGWMPRHALDETLRDTLDWWRTEVHAG
jgi:GDP-4-dehydro-6-deoxy-D-mannose reductase